MERSKGDETSARAHVSKTPLPKRPTRSVTPPTMTSAELDRLIEQYLSKLSPKVEPAPLTSDVEFVRRIYFDLAGARRLRNKFSAFVSDRSKDKRARLLDALLESPEYARNWARYWRDVIRFHATNQNVQPGRYDVLEDWLAEQFTEERALGRDRHGADHGHRPRRRERRGELRAGPRGQARRDGRRGLADLPGRADPVRPVPRPQDRLLEARAVPRVRRVLRRRASAGRSCEACRASFPSSTWWPRAARGTRCPTRTTRPSRSRSLPGSSWPRSKIGAVAAREPGRRRAADARRLVRHRPGQPLVRPGVRQPDLVRPDGRGVLRGRSTTSAPSERPRPPRCSRPWPGEWQKGGYDIRWLFRTILNTKAYQRQGPLDGQRRPARPRSPRTARAGCGPTRSSRPWSRRSGLPADLTPVANNQGNRAMAAKGPGGKGKGRARSRLPAQGPAKKATSSRPWPPPGWPVRRWPPRARRKIVRLGGPRVLFNALFGVDPSIPNDDVLGTIPQALFLMNSPMVHNRTQARPGTVLGEILTHGPERPGRPRTPSTSASSPASRRPRKSRPARTTWATSATAPRRSRTSTGA